VTYPSPEQLTENIQLRRRKLWLGTTREERERNEQEAQIEEAGLVAELRSVGLPVRSAWDLVNWRGPIYPEAIPILLRHLPILYSDRNGEGIARALARPFARRLAWDIVLEMYRTEPDFEKSGFKNGLAVALSAMARPSDIETLIELFDDPQNGSSRIFFIRNLVRSKRPTSLEALVRHRKNPSFAPEVEHQLKKKAKKATSTQTSH
jgi:hypothetical protein